MEELNRLGIDKNDEFEINLLEFVRILFDKLWIVILCFTIFGATAFAGSPHFWNWGR